MKTIITLFFVVLISLTYGQTLPNVTGVSNPNPTIRDVGYSPKPDYGLAVTGAGMSICAIGTTLKTSAYTQYSGKYGITHINRENNHNQSLKLSTLSIGLLLTLTGILIQNHKKIKKLKNG